MRGRQSNRRGVPVAAGIQQVDLAPAAGFVVPVLDCWHTTTELGLTAVVIGSLTWVSRRC
jgi:hypothetical protein